MSYYLGVGGGAGFVALVLYALATSHRAYRTLPKSVTLVALLYVFVIAMLIGFFGWASRSAKYPYRIVWQVHLVVWGAGIIATIALSMLWYWYLGASHAHRWEMRLLNGAIWGLCGGLVGRFGLKRKWSARGARPAGAAVSADDQNTFTLTLTHYPSTRKVAVIKVVRGLTGLSIEEAKDLVEGLPCTIVQSRSQADLELFRKELEASGAQVEIK